MIMRDKLHYPFLRQRIIFTSFLIALSYIHFALEIIYILHQKKMNISLLFDLYPLAFITRFT